MELTEKQELFLQQNSLAVLATADLENQPRAILVGINSVNKNELVITDNEMQLTKIICWRTPRFLFWLMAKIIIIA